MYAGFSRQITTRQTQHMLIIDKTTICGNKMPTRCNRGFYLQKTSVASSWHFISTY